MRLTEYEIKSIKKAFFENFEEGDIYLFGSRVDDTKKGGDIDLYLCPERKYDNEFDRKLRFIARLDEYIGQQKIDVIMEKDPTRLIEKVAKRDGIKL